jgi:hypothetical protein
MVGIIADAIRLHKTSRQFSGFFDQVRNVFPENLKELKGSRILYGKGAWRQVDADMRKRIFAALAKWLDKRKHGILISAVDTAKAQRASKTHTTIPNAVACDPWVAAALNISLQIQAKHQGEQKNKGNTFLFIDDNPQKLPMLCELLWSPPKWLDGYYPKEPEQEHLNQIVDTAFAVRSHHCGLIQVADLLAFIVRRHLELLNQVTPAEWNGEPTFIHQCLEPILPRIYKNSAGMKSANRSPSACWYRAIAPNGYDELLKGRVK